MSAGSHWAVPATCVAGADGLVSMEGSATVGTTDGATDGTGEAVEITAGCDGVGVHAASTIATADVRAAARMEVCPRR